MTAVAPRPVVTRPYPVQRPPRGSKFLAYLHTTDPKVLGVMYIATSFTWFMIGGLMALFMRAELARPARSCTRPKARRWGRWLTAANTLSCSGGLISCSTAPQAQWQPQTKLETMLATDGFKVRQIKVEKGCYEVYATDKSGARVNLAYNAETLQQLANPEAGEN